MHLRPLGSTGLTVTPIGLGLAALGRPSYINLGRDEDLGQDRTVAAMERRCHEVLDAAYAVGMRYVDAARSYGLAETFLASWFDTRSLPPGTVSVGSKWGYAYVGGWQLDAAVHEIKDLSVEQLRRQFAESRGTLGAHLGVYQIHSATLESGVLDDERVLSELARLASDGVAIGLTVSGPRQGETIRRAFEVSIDGVNPFQCVQATWNLLEPSAGPTLAEARARGWGVIVKESVANGQLATHASDRRATRVLDELTAATGATRDALAIAAVLANPWVDVVLSGAVTPAQVRSNADALQVRLTPDDVKALAAFAEPPSQYWERRSALRWG